MKALTLAALLLAALTMVQLPVAGEEEELFIVAEYSVEMQTELALSAAPPPLRAEAGVWILGSDGYTRSRESRNGIDCLIETLGPGTQAPTCWDPEGTETIMKMVMERAKLRASGLEEEAVQAKINEGYRTGRFRAPERTGIAYMLSDRNFLPTPNGIRTIAPHYMIYAPYVTDEDIGGGHGELQPFMLSAGTPHAYIIIWAEPQS